MGDPKPDSDAHRAAPAPPAGAKDVHIWFPFALSDPARGLVRVAMMDAFYEGADDWHAHPYVQVVIVLQGGLTVRFQRFDDVPLGPGEGIIVPISERHLAEPTGDQRRLLAMVLRIAPIPRNDLHDFVTAGIPPRTWRCHPATLRRSVAELRRMATHGTRPGSPEILRAAWGLFVSEAAAEAPSASPEDPAPADRDVDRRVLYVESQMRRLPQRAYDGEALARSIHVSVSQMTRLFAKHRGISPLRRLQAIRLEQAEQYLAYSTLTVKEIADRCGFAGPDHFTRCFKERHQETPRDFRGRHRPSAARSA